MTETAEIKYLFPPRPEAAIAPSQMKYYEDRGWVAQIKKNGTCVVIFRTQDGVDVWNRHQERLKWVMPRQMEEFLMRYFKPDTVLVGELLHFKTPHIKNTLYLFDILVNAGEDLTGTTMVHRHGIIRSLLGSCKYRMANQMGYEMPSFWQILGTNGFDIWVAQNILGNFEKLFRSLKEGEDEGLVLKNPKAILKDCSSAKANGIWQVKCRKEHKNYGF